MNENLKSDKEKILYARYLSKELYLTINSLSINKKEEIKVNDLEYLEHINIYMQEINEWINRIESDLEVIQ